MKHNNYSLRTASIASQSLKERNYWLNKLSGDLEKVAIPYTYKKINTKENRRQSIDFQMGGEIFLKLMKLANNSDTRLYMVLAAVLFLLINKYTGKQDIMVGTTISRQDDDIEPINTILALRNQLKKPITFKELLLQVKQTYLEAVEHQDYPLGALLHHLRVPAAGDDFSLFDIAAILENIHEKKYLQHIKLGVVFSFSRRPGRIDGVLEYKTSLYEKYVMTGVITHYTHLLHTVLADVEVELSRVEVLPEDEKLKLIHVFNRTGAEYPKDKVIHRLFQEQARKTPDYIALVHHQESVTYNRLNEKANQLARWLKKRQMGTGYLVGLIIAPSIEMITAILGILKAGGAYLPVVPDSPGDRIRYILEDSNLDLLLVHEKFNADFAVNRQWMNIVSLELPGIEPSNPGIINSPDDPVYVTYTSGSTGRPKGVMTQHNHVIAYLNAFYEVVEITAHTVMLQQSSYTFDVFVEEVYSVLFKGGKVAVPDRGQVIDIQLLSEFINKHGINTVDCSPLLLNQLNQTDNIAGVHTFISGGDLLKKEYIDNLLKRSRVYNSYGPTETTVCVTYYECAREDRDNIPIGKPLANYQVYILDKDNHLLPPGIPGELCAAGDGVARGYLNNPELTAEKFCLRRGGGSFCKNRPLDPHKNFLLFIPPSTHLPIYHTGDWARWLPDGNIEFLGRIDHQVKLRGFRVELGELENQVLTFGGIKETAAAVKETEQGDKLLCAFIVPTGELSLVQLREFLEKKLPAYMIPSYFVKLERFPLTANGKIDRQALADYELEIETGEDFIPPGDEVEQTLAAIWVELLDIEYEKISINDDFFQVGGHSLNAALLITKIHKALHVKLTFTDIFKSPSIKELGHHIKSVKKDTYTAINPVAEKEYYILSPAQRRIYILQHMEKDNISYNGLETYILKGPLKKEKLQETFRKMIQQHESLRTSFYMLNKKPVQRVHERVEFEIEYNRVGVKVDEIISNFIRPFDLSAAPLLRVGLIKIRQDKHILMVDMHHIVSDGTSREIFIEDFLALYAGQPLPSLRVRYKDYAQWQCYLLESGTIKAQEDYWKGLYPDAAEIPKLNLPVDFKRPEVFTFAGAYYNFKLGKEHAVKFKELNVANGGTLYMNLLAALDVLFYKYTGQSDIIIGSGVAGRRHDDLQRTIGMFVNMLAMRNHPEGEKTYETFLKEVIDSSLKALENQDVQFEDLVDHLGVERDPAHNPLFDVTMVVQNFMKFVEGITLKQGSREIEVLPLTGEDFPLVGYEAITSKFDMTFFTHEHKGDVFISLEYYTGIFKEETIRRLVMHFKRVIEIVTSQPSIKLRDIDIISPGEKKQVLFQLNDTVAGYPGDKTIHELFEEQVEKKPDTIAVTGPGPGTRILEKPVGADPRVRPNITEQVQFTYRELNEQSNQLGRYLHFEKYLQAEEAVGVLMERSSLLLAALLGILKAGAAYVPLETNYPETRLKDIINDAGIRMLISQKNQVKILNRLQWECSLFHTFLCLDSANVTGEEEKEKSGLMDEELWEYVGQSAVDDITAGGWLTGTTGQPFTREEMDEYGDNILRKLSPILHQKMRVLEIGCASGITMYRIAPLVGFYYGTDLSHVIIEKNKEQVMEESHDNIRLACLPAHEIHKLEEKNFDLVIINSVIQSFHGHNYLRSVIRQVLDLMTNKGHLFIGDIMDQDLKGDLIRYMKKFKQDNPGKNYNTKTDWSEELFISRSFFEDLVLEFPGIHQVEFSDKIYTIENELTEFRYDALLTVDKESGRKKRGSEARITSKHKYQEDAAALQKYAADSESSHTQSFSSAITPGCLAYVIHTSGSSGRPKGVMVEHDSVVRLVKQTNFIEWKKGDRLLPTGSIAFDISTFEIWGPLLNGVSLVLADKAVILDSPELEQVLYKHQVTHLHLIPQLFDQLVSRCPGICNGLEYFLVGGDLVRTRSINEIRKKHKDLKILHMYGPTENTTFSTFLPVDRDYEEKLPIGYPVANSTVYILDKGLQLQPIGVYGELYTGGRGVARGYLNNPELTAEKFCLRRPGGALFEKTAPPGPPCKNFSLKRAVIHDAKPHPETNEINQKLLQGVQGDGFLEKSPPGRRRQKIYRTGDLARWQFDGNIEFLGRIDHQFKIRGMRIELGEIENCLLDYSSIKEAAAAARTNSDGDLYLCAYIVAAASQTNAIDLSDLRHHLENKLPDYMIPTVFITLEKIPLTTNGKIDQKSLPDPQIGFTAEDYTPPRSQVEETLERIWADILGIERHKIGIDANFFQVGGHSLRATILVSRIHKELDVPVPLSEIFTSQTIRQLSRYIRNAVKDRFAGIEPVEKKEYYPLSSAQKRLYIIQHMDQANVGYNMWVVVSLQGKLEKQGLEEVFRKFIIRHESFRTSFVTAARQPVQKVQEEVDFEIEYHDLQVAGAGDRCRGQQEGTSGLAPLSGEPTAALISSFIRPFDLSRAPLLRVGLIKRGKENYLLMLDMHHIISDGKSVDIFIKEFMALYQDRELPVVPVRYKDFSEWQNQMFDSGKIETQEQYWLKEFDGRIPVLHLPTDFPRPDLRSFEGGIVKRSMDKSDTDALKKMALDNHMTMSMVLLAIYYILLAKLSGQDDVVVGVTVSGRRHADLDGVIGMFVNSLAMRNYPQADKSFINFLKEVKKSTLAAFENQDYPFEKLVEKIALKRIPGHNPLFDVEFVMQLEYQGVKGISENTIPGLKLTPYPYERTMSNYDLFLYAEENETGQSIRLNLEYWSKLFKKESMENLLSYFLQITGQIINDIEIKISDIRLKDEHQNKKISSVIRQNLEVMDIDFDVG